ncbi:MAG: pirin family protein [Oceanospirillaceae bacterium]|nr:pirin family protein [Oceanospirillaceae bacterium]MCP5335382.1 pirin family protein [Oceanospirillaceae bacterium]
MFRKADAGTELFRGSLTHADSIGHKEVLEPGDLQLMSAGRGIYHSEYNHSDQPLHFLQIWLKPAEQQTAPSYQQINRMALTSPLLVGPQGSGAPLIIKRDAAIYFYELRGTPRQLSVERAYAYLHIFSGSLHIGGQTLSTGDGIMLQHGEQLSINPSEAGFLWFDMR